MSEELIVSVNDILFQSPSCQYIIPSYQRGYKWTYDEVFTLLKDVDAFEPSGNKFYCLQNITLVLPDATVTNYNVVDGQQRLTTLLVIFAYLYKDEEEKLNILRNKLIYDVRAQTKTFITKEVCNRSYWEGCEQYWGNINGGEDQEVGITQLSASFKKYLDDNDIYNYRDIFHLYIASFAIWNFFRNRQDDFVNGFRIKILNNVKLIKNVLWQTEEPKVFAQVNAYKVPLDAADLIRAFFITRVPMATVDETVSMRSVIGLNEKRTRLGLELDMINHWWQNTEHGNFYKRFIPGNLLDDKGRELFNYSRNEESGEISYPIDMLYLLYLVVKGENRVSNLRYFEKQTAKDDKAQNCYKEIVEFHRTLVDWFADSEIYHLIGVLWLWTKDEAGRVLIKELYDKWRDSKNKESFTIYLKTQIKDGFCRRDDNDDDKRVPDIGYWLDKIIDDERKFGYDWYDDPENMLQKVLILHDAILHINDAKSEHPKFEKLAVSHFYSYGQGRNQFDGIQEDKEHIFPQTPVSARSAKDFSDRFKDYWDDLLPTIIAKKRGDQSSISMSEVWKNSYDEISSNIDKDKRKAIEQFFAAHDNSFNDGDHPDFGKFRDEQFCKPLFTDNNEAIEEIKQTIKQMINAFIALQAEIPVCSIGNIVLLHSRTNRSYGNKFFPQKRSEILRLFNKGDFIRLHTRKVFSKEYSINKDQEYNEWSRDDIISTATKLRENIETFFKGVN